MVLNLCLFVFLIFALVNILKMMIFPAKTKECRERRYYNYYLQRDFNDDRKVMESKRATLKLVKGATEQKADKVA
ncbi:MAG: hypothetical protein ACI4QE_01995 [Acutalibacteraceae bacterium]